SENVGELPVVVCGMPALERDERREAHGTAGRRNVTIIGEWLVSEERLPAVGGPGSEPEQLFHALHPLLPGTVFLRMPRQLAARPRGGKQLAPVGGAHGQAS